MNQGPLCRALRDSECLGDREGSPDCDWCLSNYLRLVEYKLIKKGHTMPSSTNSNNLLRRSTKIDHFISRTSVYAPLPHSQWGSCDPV